MHPDTTEFLALLRGHHTFQTFDDKNRDASLTRVLQTYDHETLTQLNELGAGIYICINETDGRGRKASNIIRVRAHVVDLDGAPIPALMPLDPTWIIETSPGRYHLWWVLTDAPPLESFTPTQEALASWFGSDPTVKDLPRVMRVPGRHNHKRDGPFLITIVGGTRQEVTSAAVRDAYPPDEPEPPAPPAPRPAAPASQPGSVPTPDKILEVFLQNADLSAGRNHTGFNLALQVRDNGHPQHEAERILRTYQELVSTNGQHEYTTHEALESVRQAYTRPAREPWAPLPETPQKPLSITGKIMTPPSETPDLTRYHRTDYGNAERLVALHGHDLAYTPDLGWLEWDGMRWAVDRLGGVERRAKNTIRELKRQVLDDDDDKIMKWALQSEKRSGITNMIALAESEPEIASRLATFDTQDHYLNTRAGTVDLRTGQTHAHNRGDHLTQLAPTDLTATACPTWLQFQHDITDGDADLLLFKQKAYGYTLCGSVTEQVLFIAYGSGANGKSTEFEVVRRILGDYASHTEFGTFAPQRRESIRNDLARLRNARFVTAIESDTGVKLNESLVKSITGGEPITARFLHKEYFEFHPKFKVWLATNHLPTITGTDHGIWRRIRLIPYTVSIPPERQDKSLTQKLMREAPGILAWMIEGYRRYQLEGLGMPDAVREATEGYRSDMDVVQQFIDDCLEVGPRETAKATDLRQVFEWWCKQVGHRPMSHRAFTQALKERGFENKRSMSLRYWQGFSMTPDSLDSATFAPEYSRYKAN